MLERASARGNPSFPNSSGTANAIAG